MIRKYEMMAISNISLGENKAKELSKGIQNYITSLGGKIEKTDFWGKRKFAYEIKHQTEGYYDVIYYELDSEKNSKLVENLNLKGDLIRYLITLTSEVEKKEN